METPYCDHGRVYFKQFGAERVNDNYTFLEYNILHVIYCNYTLCIAIQMFIMHMLQQHVKCYANKELEIEIEHITEQTIPR